MPLPECLSSGAACLPLGLLLCASLTYLRHPCPSPLWNAGLVLCRGQQGTSAGEETGGDGGSHERGHRSGQERSGEEEEGKREKAKEGEVAGVGELGDGLYSLGLHQLLSGGGSLCILFFILSRYSCWDTASTDARISLSSQSFRPMSQSLRQQKMQSLITFIENH